MGEFWLTGRVGILPMHRLSLSDSNELLNELYTTDTKRLLLGMIFFYFFF